MKKLAESPPLPATWRLPPLAVDLAGGIFFGIFGMDLIGPISLSAVEVSHLSRGGEIQVTDEAVGG